MRALRLSFGGLGACCRWPGVSPGFRWVGDVKIVGRVGFGSLYSWQVAFAWKQTRERVVYLVLSFLYAQYLGLFFVTVFAYTRNALG